jgi:hypothetical protein
LGLAVLRGASRPALASGCASFLRKSLLYQPQSTCGYASSRTRLMLSTRIGYRSFGVEKERAALTPLMGSALRNQLRPVHRPPLATVAKPCRASCPKKPCEIEAPTVVCGRCGVLAQRRI